MTPRTVARTLDRRTLNRALLARQLLLRREPRSPAEVIEHLVGLQAQEPRDPYVALWSRIEGFDPGHLSDLLAERHAVRAQLLRATIHLATARDALAIRPVLEPVLGRTFASNSPFGRSLAAAGVPVDAVVAAGREFLEERPRTRAELRTLLGPIFPAADSTALAQAVTYLVPVVQIPPRGLWRQSGQPTWSPIEAWLGRPLPSDRLPDGLVLRYLAAFGPATAADVRTWSGLAGIAEILDRLRPRLRTFRDDAGRELVDLPDAPIPDPDVPAPIRFLPTYDNVTLSHADRGRIIDETRRHALLAGDQLNYGSILIDGFAQASWRLLRDRHVATIELGVPERLADHDLDAVGAEGDRLIAFLAPPESTRDVQIRRLSTA